MADPTGATTREQRGGRVRHLLALNHFANPLDAPGGTRLVELSSRLRGWRTTIVAADRNLFTRRRRRVVRPGYVTVPTLPYDSNGPARIANWVTYAVGATVVGLRVERPDVVLASSPHLLTGLAGWLVARVRRVPFVFEVRDMWPRILVDVGRLRPGSPSHRVLRALERFLYHHAEAIVVLAAGVADAVVDEGIPPERIHLVPNGADPDDFTPSRPREELRRRYGFGGFTIVYTGAHGPANGLDLVLDAARDLARELPEVTFVLVGDGLSRPGLMERARRESLHNVVFLQPVPKAEIPDLLAAADAGLHVLADVPLFLYGVSPNKLFDYMAAGLPVLTNTGGEIGRLVTDRDTGVATAPRELADGVRRLVAADAARRAAWGANGRALIRAERDRGAMAARLQLLLDRLCPASPAPDGLPSPAAARRSGPHGTVIRHPSSAPGLP